MRRAISRFLWLGAMIASSLMLGTGCPPPPGPCVGLDCSDGRECTSDVCIDGQCSNTPVANGTTCDGGSGACQNGICEAAGPDCVGVDCSDNNECTSDVCTGGTCTNPPVANGTSCDGGNGACQNGICELICSAACDDGNECTSDVCTDGTCSNPPLANGTSCDGGNGTCQSGTCRPLGAAPSTPQLTRVEFLSLSAVRLEWNDSNGETSYEVEYSPNGTDYATFATLPANQTAFDALSVPPCATTHLRLRARNAHGYSGYANSGALVTDVVAIIEIANSPNTALVPGRFLIGCWDSLNQRGGLAIYDNDGNGILDSSAQYDFWTGEDQNVFPRVPFPVCELTDCTLYLAAGTAYEPPANLVAYFRLNTWPNEAHENYFAIHFQASPPSISAVRMWGGDMMPFRGMTKPNAGLAMFNEVGGVAYNVNYGLPRGQRPGQMTGSARGLISLADSYNGVLYSAEVTVEDMNLPISNDDGSIGGPRFWTGAEPISEQIAGEANPQIAVAGYGDALAVWEQGGQIWANRFVGSIRRWTGPARVDQDSGNDASDPRVAVDGDGNGLVVWTQSDSVMANRFDASSRSWEGALPVETRASGAWTPAVAMSATGNGLAVWKQEGSIWANDFEAASGSWGDARVIETDTAEASNPQVAMNPAGDGLAVWEQSGRIWGNHFDPAMQAWEEAVDIDDRRFGGPAEPRVAMHSSGRWWNFAVWHTATMHVWANSYVSPGYWRTTELLHDGRNPEVAMSGVGDTLFVFEWSGTILATHVKRSTGRWTRRVPIDSSPAAATEPQVAMDVNGNGLAVWKQDNSIWANHLSFSTATWGAATLLETDSAEGFQPQVGMDAVGNGIAVWQQGNKIVANLYE